MTAIVSSFEWACGCTAETNGMFGSAKTTFTSCESDNCKRDAVDKAE